MLEQMGRCKGIENYSRHLSGRKAGEPPPTLIDYFPDDFLMFVDESHQTIPQIAAMYRGDRSRKETLVEYGFRLPSALDNRPLRFEEWEARAKQMVCVSATPGDYEIERASGVVVEQIIRPTGLLDPGDRGAAGGEPGRRPAGRDPRARQARRARAGHHPDQAAGRGSDRVLRRARACACATCTPTSTPSSASRSCATCASASSTCWSASTCCARGSICPRCRWSPSSTPTRRASCAPSARSSRPSAAPPATCAARSSCTRTARPSR